MRGTAGVRIEYTPIVMNLRSVPSMSSASGGTRPQERLALPVPVRRDSLGLLVAISIVVLLVGMARSVEGQVDPSDSAATVEEGIENGVEDQVENGDEAIRSRLQALFGRVEAFREIQVDVEAGVVRLTGETLGTEAREEAVSLARDTEGVVYVEDRIGVVTDLSERLAPAVDRIRESALAAVAFLPLLLVSMILVGLFLFTGRMVARWDGGPHLRFARTPFTRSLIRQITLFVFGAAGLLVALELLDATAVVGAVLGTAGVLGLAVGFAFKDIVENHLAGVMLSLRQPFAPNDHIVVGSHEGKVVRLTARETILMTLAGNHLRIPNAEIFKSVLTNYTRNPLRRFDFKVSVGTSDDLIEAQATALDALEAMKGVVEEPEPSARVIELGDSWVTLHFFGWVDQQQADFGRVRSEAIRLVKQALEVEGVSMPSPEYQVKMVSGPGEPLGEEDDGTSWATGADEPLGAEGTSGDVGPTPPSEQLDVSVDHSLDAQIEEDRRTSGEDDLLTQASDQASDHASAQESAPDAESADGDAEEDEPASGEGL